LAVFAFGFAQEVNYSQSFGMRENLEHSRGTVQLLRFNTRMQWFHEVDKK
jgi:hypothetical protein